MKTIREHVREAAFEEIDRLKIKYDYDRSLFLAAERKALQENDQIFDEVLRIVFIAKDYGLNFAGVEQYTDNWNNSLRHVRIWFDGIGVLENAKNQAFVKIRGLIEKDAANAILSEFRDVMVEQYTKDNNRVIALKYTKK